MLLLLIIGILSVTLVVRILYTMYIIRHSDNTPLVVSSGGVGEGVVTLVVLGSGGHTGEMLKMVAALDHQRYAPRTYLVADTDIISISRLKLAEQDIQAYGDGVSSDKKKTKEIQYNLEIVPRSREVGQSWSSSCLTTLWALIFSFLAVARHRPTLILTNGPGTCVPVCLSALVLRILGVCYGRVVFVESLCRVQSLSLSGRILYHLADHFFVQWPGLVASYPRAKYLGRLV